MLSMCVPVDVWVQLVGVVLLLRGVQAGGEPEETNVADNISAKVS